MNKELKRSASNKVIGGVCAGLANYFNIDPTLMRVGFLIALLAFGVGPILYLIMWLIMPVGA